MLSVVNSCSLLGLESYMVQVEVDVTDGLPNFDIVGLPDASIRESKDRVRSAIKNSGFKFPSRRVTVNLAPADTKKAGPIFDLPIALGVLAATEQLGTNTLQQYCVLGELSLSGELRKVPGVIAMASGLSDASLKALIVPEGNSQEAALATKLDVYGLDSLQDVIRFLNDEEDCLPTVYCENELEWAAYDLDMVDVVGQFNAKRALEIAAGGGHNLLFIGSPGTGKTMLAKSMPSILPKMTFEEALETTKIYSISGLLPKDKPLITQRPFRSPHHNISASSLIGGGSIPKPGEISLASHGVLFLDELTEYSKKVLESLRQPLEDREVLISRVAAAVTFPARFILVGAINPCPCGYFGDSTRECICSPFQIKKYLSKISGPLIDRFDLQVQVPRVKRDDIDAHNAQPPSISKHIRERVEIARKRQTKRFKGSGISCNAEMSTKQIKKYCVMCKEAKEFYKIIYDKYSFTMRSYNKILKIAKTIADLEQVDIITEMHIGEALQYRDYDRLIKEEVY